MAGGRGDLLKLVELQGYSSPTTTYRVYARFSPGHLLEAVVSPEGEVSKDCSGNAFDSGCPIENNGGRGWD